MGMDGSNFYVTQKQILYDSVLDGRNITEDLNSSPNMMFMAQWLLSRVYLMVNKYETGTLLSILKHLISHCLGDMAATAKTFLAQGSLLELHE